jgi:serine/threonine-protein kinase
MIEQRDERIGQVLEDGRYRITGPLGMGSMGRVYLALDRHLQTDVVIKFPLLGHSSLAAPDLLDRFELEARSLVRLSHPHIVKIIDVGRLDEQPYVVLQFLSGGTLKDRLLSGPGGEPRPLPPESLRAWLPDIARALDFVHRQGHIHRDVKPANIFFDQHGNAFLGDFGIVKARALDDEEDWKANSLTAPGLLLGTPSYIAPELVLGLPTDGRSDQYSLALTVHEVLAGRNVMEGPSPSATMVNQTRLDPAPLDVLVPGIDPQLSAVVQRGLAKDPDDRFPTCTALAQEILATLAASEGSGSGPFAAPVTTPCPSCCYPLPSSTGDPVEVLRCPRCRHVYRYESTPNGPVLVPLASPSAATSVLSHPDVATGPDSLTDFEVDDADRLEPAPVAAAAPKLGAPELALAPPARRRWTWIGAGLAALVMAGLAWLLTAHWPFGSPGAAHPDAAAVGPPVPLSIAYGTEMKYWLEEALKSYRETPAGQRVALDLQGLGSVEGADAVLAGPGPKPFHVWMPASSAYRGVFERDWGKQHPNKPILRAENLALTPMVFVMWQKRHDEFIKKYQAVTFRTLAEAMEEKRGWGAIAGHPDWGQFKFSHADPDQSNSGLMALILMAYDFTGKENDLTVEDVRNPEFRSWLEPFERSVTRFGGKLTHSTGKLMENMVVAGPKQFDCLLLYENLAIEYMEKAMARWKEAGPLIVVYPDPNIWNEHPYYVLDVPWSHPDQRVAADDFLDYLWSEPIQRLALDHGFRPGNPSVPVEFPGSPLTKYAEQGVRIDLPRLCEPPPPAVLDALRELYAQIRR